MSERKWMKVGNVKKSKDPETGKVIPGRYFMRISQDVTLKKGDTLSMFEYNKEAEKERLVQVVDSGRLSEEAAQDILETTVYDISLKLK